jgi:thioredoxin
MKKLFPLFCLMAGLWLSSCAPTDKKAQPADEPETAAAAPAPAVQPLTTETFIHDIYDFRNEPQWKYKGSLPCVIDIYTDWCKPCQLMAPIMEKLAEDYKGKIRFYKVNAEMEGELAAYLEIEAIPTFLFCPTAGAPEKTVGGMSEEQLRQILDNLH